MALDWGWEKKGGILVPAMTDLEIAPSAVQRIIRCKCMVNTKTHVGQQNALVRSSVCHACLLVWGAAEKAVTAVR